MNKVITISEYTLLNDVYDLIANNPQNVGTDFTNENEITDLFVNSSHKSIYFTDAQTGVSYALTLNAIHSPNP